MRQRVSTRKYVIELLKKHPNENFAFYLELMKSRYSNPSPYLGCALNTLFKSGNLIRYGKRSKYTYRFVEKEKKPDPLYDRENITPEYVAEHFAYNPDTGVITRKKSRYANKVGTNPCRDRLGYLIVGIKQNNFFAHRIAWVIHYGKWPEKLIDHINGDKKDNRISNLREATYAQNIYNNHSPVKSATGYRGVAKNRSGSKYVARIKINRKLVVLGSFDTPEEAYEAYKTKAKEIRGEFYKEPAS